MSSRREFPVRPQRSSRPKWLLPLLIAVAVLVVVGVGYGAVSLFRGGGDSTASDVTPSASPTACQTTMVPASELLPAAADVKVNVFNATKKSGLASDTAKELSARDFVVMKVANDPADKRIKGIAEIRYGPKGQLAAELLLLHVPGAEMVEDDRTGKKIDLALGEGYEALAPTQGVEAQLSELRPMASGPGCEPAGLDSGSS